jgi:hypothetical protein
MRARVSRNAFPGFTWERGTRTKDTTFDDDMFVSGYMAVCDRPKGEEFFLAVLYHEWFIIEKAEVFEG